MNFKLVLLSLVVLIQFSCEYEPSGFHDVELDSEGIDSCTIILSPYSTDTINLLSEIEYTFRLSIDSNVRINTISVFIDSTQITGSSHSESSFSINPIYYNSGYHILKIKAITSSGTNSMADLYNYEKREYTWNWIIFVDKERPNQINITNIYAYEGRLKIEWEKYTRINFQFYRLRSYRWSAGRNSFATDVFDVTIRNQDQNYYIDSNFTGGKALYYLEVYTQNPEYSISSEREFEVNYPVFYKAEIYYDSTVIRWAKCPFYKNFSRYYIICSDNSDYTNYFSSTNINDTVYTDKSITFGTNTNYTLHVWPNYLNATEDFYSITASFDRDHLFHPFTYLKPINDSLISFSNSRRLFLYNTNRQTIENEIEINSNFWIEDAIFDVYAGSKYLCYSDEEKIYLVDPVTFNLIKTIEIPLNYRNIYKIRNIALSKQGYICMLLVSKILDPSDKYILQAINIETLETSESIITNKYLEKINYLSNGNFIYFGVHDSGYVYKQEGLKFQLHSSIKRDNAAFIFNNQNDDELFVINNTIKVFSIKDNVLKRTINANIPAYYYPFDVDYYTGYLGYTTYSNYIVYDMENEKIVYDIPLTNNYVTQYPIVLLNNILYSSYYDSRYLKLQE